MYTGVLTNRIKARIKKKFEFAILKVSARIPLMLIVRCGDDSVMPRPYWVVMNNGSLRLNFISYWQSQGFVTTGNSSRGTRRETSGAETQPSPSSGV